MSKINIFERKLPLLEIEKVRFSNINFKNSLFVCVQHLCSTTYSLFNTFFDLGLDSHNLFVLGKCYSTNPKVFSKLIQENVNVSSDSLLFDSHSSYDMFFENSVEKLINHVVKSNNLNNFERIILLDDGGHLIEKFQKHLGKKKYPVVGIEQTSSGYNRLKNIKLDFPVINPARSWIKLDYESPLIGDLLRRKLIENLTSILTTRRRGLIIGFGPIGQSAYNVLNKKFEIDIFDLVKEKSTITKEQFRKKLTDYDLIIGCTGTKVLAIEDLIHLTKPMVLASASSSDIEFDAVKIRNFYKKYHDCHTNIEVAGIRLLNSGFPITFDNDFDGIDTDDYQLTRTILFTAVCQGFKTNKNIKGIIELKDDYQHNILENWMKIKIL